MNYRKIAEEIFLAGVDRVLPDRLINNAVSITGNRFLTAGLSFDLNAISNIYVIGAGKASALMAAGVERILGSRITDGHIVVKYDHSCVLERIKVTEAGHPVPDANGFRATRSILKIAHKAAKNDLVICLLSGGGSALLADFPRGSSPGEIMLVNDLLVRSGSTINEINAVRKHLSDVKGGQLARAIHPATSVSLILSDVIGDPLDVIASGPTVPDPSTFHQAVEIIKKYNLTMTMPGNILDYLAEGAGGRRDETPKPGDQLFDNTFNILIGNSRIALEAAATKASLLNIAAEIINDRIQGEVSAVSKYITETALKTRNDNNVKKPVCLLFGGEPTLTVTGKGLGGRNQHLALQIAKLLQNTPGITILSGGTDGNDGPTDAAGAVVDSDTFQEALSENIDPDKFLSEFDSYHFFQQTGGHIITGPTMTNVMDIIVVIVE
jgi:glycerate 2-kinase